MLWGSGGRSEMFYKGRVNRATYWLTLAMLAALSTVVALLGFKPTISEIVLLIVAVPRLHDLGRSGWWALAGIGVEIGGLVVGVLTNELLIISAAVTLLVVGLMLWLG